MADGYQDTAWRPIPGFEGYYEAHPDGIVRSVNRIESSRGFDRLLLGRIITPTLVGPARCQYLGVRLYVNTKASRLRLSCVVAMTFIGPRPDGFFVCHSDGDRMNNRLGNLYYGTPEQNAADKFVHAIARFGVRMPWAKLAVEDVRYIRANPERKSRDELASMFEVGSDHIRNVEIGRKWKNVA